MPSSNTMLAHEPSQVPENCAIGGKQGRRGGALRDVVSQFLRLSTRILD